MGTAEKTRLRIRRSAQVLVAEHGAGNLTIDAVARHAGVSKGGLLYHYANKQALLEAMLEDLLSTRKALFLSSKAKQGHTAQLKAMINTEFSLTLAERATANAILASGAENPALLDPVREYFTVLFDHLAQGAKDPALGTTAILAVQGIQLLETLGLYQFESADKDRLRLRLLALVS